MKKIVLNLDKNKKYVIACSFGPDSMALLNAAINEKLNIVVAHVNYHKRNVSSDEQNNLKNYCDERKIPFFVLDLLNAKSEGNFQEWAREKRYEFFAEILKKENADYVLVAHQQDDVIETYLMQKKRENLTKYAGISRENELFGVKIIRPLLNYSKRYLQDYDDENKVPYSIDESNLTNHYTRNKFRHEIVEKLSLEERNKLLEEIEQKNNRKIDLKLVKTKDEFLNLSYEEIVILLNFYMNKVHEHRDLSKGFVENIKKSISHKTNLRISISKSLLLEVDYGDLYFVNKSKLSSYGYSFNNIFSNEFLDIDFSNGTDDRKIDLKNMKLLVKNCNKNDKLIINNYSSKIKRLFIDWKMPLFLRDIWPGIYDEKGTLLYVPRYKKQFEDNHTSKFVINTKYFEEF